MNIFAVRHTKVNVEQGICYGQADMLPADSFIEECKAVFKLIKNIKVSRIYCSPLSRCQILAEALFPQKTIVMDGRLKEFHFGDWELKAWDEIYQTEQGKHWMENYQELPCPNGESYPEMIRRVDGFLNELKGKGFENVVVITHAGVIRIMKSILENRPVAELFSSYSPEYGSINRFKQ